MRAAGLTGLVLAALAVGCGKSNLGVCESRADRLAAQLAQLVDLKPSGMAPSRIDFDGLEGPGGRPVAQPGTYVELSRDGDLRLHGGSVADTADLHRQLDRRGRHFGRRKGDPIYLLVDRRLKAARLESAVAGLHDAGELRAVLFGEVRRPAARAIARELEQTASVREFAAASDRAADASERAVLLAGQFEKTIGRCAAMVRVMGELASKDADGKARHVVTAVPAALRECECKVADLDLVEYLFLVTFGAYDREQRWIPAADAVALLSQ